MTDLEMAAHKDYVEKLAASERENDRLRAENERLRNLFIDISQDLAELQRLLSEQRERLEQS